MNAYLRIDRSVTDIRRTEAMCRTDPGLHESNYHTLEEVKLGNQAELIISNSLSV